MQQVLREAMDAGAAGFATSFAFPHRGIDGKPVPSRFADRAELEALLETMGEVGRGVVSIAPGEQCPPADMFDLQIKVGVPFTWGALLTSPDRVPPPGARGEPGRVGARRRGVAAGDAPPAHLPVHPRLAVPARGQRALRRAAERVDRRAHSRPTPTPRGASR